MTDGSIRHILAGLSSGSPDAAWQEFLNNYSSLIVHIARRYEDDEDRAMYGYVYVCEKLSEHDFRRLLKFRLIGTASFRTWLTTVTGNLCIDWRRHQYGRQRPLAAIARLTELEQLVFHKLYVVGLTRLECQHALPAKYSRVSEQQISDINRRIHSLISSQQRWRLMSRKPEMISLDDPASYEQTSREAADLQPQIDAIVQAEQDWKKLKKAILELSPDERLLLHLRYRQGLTLNEVARLMKLTDLHQARRQLEAARVKLAKYMTI